MLTIKVQVIRNTAHRPSLQASYTIGSGMTIQENQTAAQNAAKHSIFPQMEPYMSWIFLVLVGVDPGVYRLGGEMVSHNTTDARQSFFETFKSFLNLPWGLQEQKTRLTAHHLLGVCMDFGYTSLCTQKENNRKHHRSTVFRWCLNSLRPTRIGILLEMFIKKTVFASTLNGRVEYIFNTKHLPATVHAKLCPYTTYTVCTFLRPLYWFCHCSSTFSW